MPSTYGDPESLVFEVLVILLHVVASLILIGVVLLQTGKRADLAGAFGGGGSQTAFGARGTATLLSKTTTVMAVVFMLTSITLSIMSSGEIAGSGSVLEQVEQTEQQEAPATPESTPPAPVDTPAAETEQPAPTETEQPAPASDGGQDADGGPAN